MRRLLRRRLQRDRRRSARCGAGCHLRWVVLVQGGSGLTENRDGFKFLMAGVHAGKVLTPDFGKGFLRGDFEYAVEVFPFWQSYTPTFQRANCVATPTSNVISCSPLYTTGGTYTGASVTPIILRWNFKGKGRLGAVGAGGGRAAVDEPQVSGVWTGTFELGK